MKTYKILVTMLRHQTFTVDQIAESTGLPSSTVHTVLRRCGDVFDSEVVGGTGRRGGQTKRYSLRPEGRDHIRAALQRNLDGLQLKADAEESVNIPDAGQIAQLDGGTGALPGVPPVLLAAEHELRYSVPESSGEAFDALLRSTARKLQVSGRMLENPQYRCNPALKQRLSAACAQLTGYVARGNRPSAGEDNPRHAGGRAGSVIGHFAHRREVRLAPLAPENVVIVQVGEEQHFSDRLTGALQYGGAEVHVLDNNRIDKNNLPEAATAVIVTVNSVGRTLSPKELLECVDDVRPDDRWVIIDMDSDSGVLANPVLGRKYVSRAATRPLKEVVDEIKWMIGLRFGGMRYTPVHP